MPKRGHFPTPEWHGVVAPVNLRRTRYLFSDGYVLDVEHAEHDGSWLREWVLNEAQRQWPYVSKGKTDFRKIVGSTAMEPPT
jgi:hypothetical protein